MHNRCQEDRENIETLWSLIQDISFTIIEISNEFHNSKSENKDTIFYCREDYQYIFFSWNQSFLFSKNKSGSLDIELVTLYIDFNAV